MDLTSGSIPVSMQHPDPETHVDVFIAGSGSAGLCAATWLARYGLSCKIVDWRPGPLEVGQADGVQCRTVEVFDSFGIAEELLREAYHVLEVVFWGDGKVNGEEKGAEGKGGKGIRRTGRAPDREQGVSHLPHVILNQARVNGLLLGAMKRFNGQVVDYDYSVKSVVVDSERAGDPDAFCVTVNTVRHGNEEVFKAKYVLACDGAHSAVRKSLGFKMIGDSTDSVWGVMDVYPRTNFPDIRRKAALQSQAGSLLIIPRESGSLVRLYIELPAGTTAKDVKLEDLQASARKIFHPYELEIADTYWWSAYSIGQRLADYFSKDDRVFLTGDACHTHSPKAGQGMNVSLQDGYNIGWKLASILKGQARPELLKTYNLEREKVAADLIDFDRGFAKAFASKSVKDPKQEKKFSELFIQAGRYTAGLMAKYGESLITRAEWSTQSLATGLIVGMRFPSTQVVRHCDAKAMQLVKALPADGRWRIVVFAGDLKEEVAAERLKKLASYLSSAKSPVSKYTPAGADVDSFIEPILVLSGQRIQIEQNQIPDYFWPITGRYRMRDIHKTFVDDESYNSGDGKAYELYGVDPKVGAIAIVRPDQYVSLVVGIDDFEVIGKFFDGFAVGRPRSDQFDLEDIVKKGVKDLNGLMKESS